MTTGHPNPQEISTLAALCTQGRFAEAEPLARALTVHFASDWFGWNVLGAALVHLGRPADALHSMQRAVLLAPTEAAVHNNLGNTLRELGRLDEAEASYGRALQLKPDYAEAHNNLGNTVQELGRMDDAEASFRRAVELRPDFTAALTSLGNTLSCTGKLDAAVVCFRKALALKPDHAPALFGLHALLLNADDMAPSIECLERAVASDPANEAGRFFLGMMLDYSGNPAAAAVHLQIAAQGSPGNRDRLDAWGYIQSASRKLPMTGSAIQTFKLAIDAAAPDGLVLEFGVSFGTSIRQIAALVAEDVHGFDSFEGLPDAWLTNPAGSYTTKGVLPDVPDNVILHAGWFADTLPGFLDEFSGPVRFMNIDCDLYRSTRTVLELLAERIIPGTVIVFDEYIGNERWREDEFRAFQEAVVSYGWAYEYLCFSFVTKQVVVRILAGIL